MAFSYKIVKGDVLVHSHNPEGKVLIPHVVNTLGVMGSGIAAGIRKKWPRANSEYTRWEATHSYNVANHEQYLNTELHVHMHDFELGEVQFVEVSENEIVANMVGQKNIGPNEFGQPPIRMDSLTECIFRLRKFVIDNKVKSVASCQFGSLRAGGNWADIEVLIKAIFHDVNVEWYTYEFVEQPLRSKAGKK